ncbi:Hypothetical predicted protein [Mytilus galloprovincialis]|uniref:Uncharacterized protein n=1 Tax=Mytilus galloprovincialis TaxID=29158 RepID=A0A8B6FDV5_MYTGA|nr:Hypothetical predicted protein [Mytilus galloprovincialis]
MPRRRRSNRSNSSDNSTVNDLKKKKPSKKKSKKKDILSSTNVNKGELYTGDITNVNNHTYPSFDNPSLMNNMNQQRFTQDTNFMYSPSPNPMFQLQNQQLCSTPNSGAIYPSMQQVQHVSPTMQYTSQQRPVWVDELFQRMDTFENKLDKLEKVGSLVTSLNAKVVKLEVNAKVMDDRLEQVEKSTQLISNNFDKVESFKTELDKVSKQMKSVSGKKNSVAEINASVENMMKENNKLKDELIDIQMKSMKNNLIFYNIKETEEEICSEIIGRFCEHNMKICGAATKVVISDAHRLGKKGEKTRPILVKFATFESRDLVKRNAKNLKSTEFGVSEQLPKEIQIRRKEKLPILKELREQEIKAYFVKDRIFVGGKEYKP